MDTPTGKTSLQSSNGLADRIDIDPLGAYISVNNNPVFYANPTATSTRIWSPDNGRLISIEDADGVRINNAYYLPSNDGLSQQVMTTDGAGQVSWQTPVPLNAFNQSLNTSNDVAFNKVTTFTVDSAGVLSLGPSTSSAVNLGRSATTTTINGLVSINSAYTLPVTGGVAGQVLTFASGSSAWQTPQIIGLYSQTAPVTVVNTTVQTSIIGAGVGSLTVPANYFTIGMGFTYRTGGLFGSNNNDTIRFRLTNSGVLFDSGPLQFSPSVAAGRPWNIDVTFIYIGGTTMITNFNFQYNNGADARGFTAQNTNNTFNPAIINTFGFTAQWNNASNNNAIVTNYGVMTKIY
jgi:hypothetical protein